MTPTLIIAIVLAFSGKPVTPHCFIPPDKATGTEDGWAYVGGNQLYIQADMCATIIHTNPHKGYPQYFIESLITLLHETGHTTGISKEGCAEKFADQRVSVALHKFWKIPYHSVRMHLLTGIMLQYETENVDTEYNPKGC